MALSAENYALRNLGESLQCRLALLILNFHAVSINLMPFLSLQLQNPTVSGVDPQIPLNLILCMYYGRTALLYKLAALHVMSRITTGFNWFICNA